MTESQWLAATPDTLPAMVDHLQARGDEDALRAFVLECRSSYAKGAEWPLERDLNTLEYWSDLARYWVNKEDDWWFPDPRINILHDVATWGPVELPLPKKTCFFCRGKKYIIDNGPNGYGPKSKDPCDVCGGSGVIDDKHKPSPWLTPTVVNIASSLRENPADAGGWAALHDSLLEAGCDQAELLAHCRGLRRCPTCEGKGYVQFYYPDKSSILYYCLDHEDLEISKYVASQIGTGPRCNKTGRVPVPPHTRNCWVLRVILSCNLLPATS